MRNKNFTTIIIVVATIILAGVAIFTAIKLYQTRTGTIAPNAPTSRPAAATGKACGDTCTSDSECRNPSANGSATRCVSGVCQNTTCIGKTIPGANCDCSSENACGQGCSASVGLCQAGSICRYVVGPSCANNPNPSVPTNTYCVPNSLPSGWITRNCVDRDQGNSYVTNSSGGNPTVLELQQACAALLPSPVPTTAPTPPPACSALSFVLASSTPTPTPTPSASPSPSPTPSPSPSPVPQCGTSCTTSSDCPSTMVCYVGVCRNPSCTTSATCLCATATPTPSPTAVGATPTPYVSTPTPTSTLIAQGPTSAPTAAPSLPESGVSTPTILGITAGAILLILGLALIL